MLNRLIEESVSRVAVGISAVVALSLGAFWQSTPATVSPPSTSGIFNHWSTSDVVAIGAILLQVVWAYRDIQSLKDRVSKLESFNERTLPRTYMPREVCAAYIATNHAHGKEEEK